MYKRRGIRWLFLWLTALGACGLVGCSFFSSETPHSVTYMDAFDTVSTITAYGVSAGDFEIGQEKLHAELLRYHRLYDIYHTYDGVANLKTLNDAAGQGPVAVEPAVLDLLSYGLTAYEQTDGRVNIVAGAVLSLWHDCREAALNDPTTATLPSADALRAAMAHTSPAALVIDRAAGTAMLTDGAARVDVGAVAKGYVAQRLADYAAQELGWTSVLLDIGGNICAVGKKNGETPFTIGVRNPDADAAQPYVRRLAVADAAVVTSGDYQRYFTVGDVRYHHIIDPDTAYPANHMRSVTVVCADSGLADVLSTALFTLPVERGLDLLQTFPGAQAVFVLSDGSVRCSPGLEAYLVD